MRLLFDYQCSIGHCFEAFVATADDRATCPICGDSGTRVPTMPGLMFDGTDSSLPRASRRWADQHERAGAQKDDE